MCRKLLNPTNKRYLLSRAWEKQFFIYPCMRRTILYSKWQCSPVYNLESLVGTRYSSYSLVYNFGIKKIEIIVINYTSQNFPVKRPENRACKVLLFSIWLPCRFSLKAKMKNSKIVKTPYSKKECRDSYSKKECRERFNR